MDTKKIANDDCQAEFISKQIKQNVIVLPCISRWMSKLLSHETICWTLKFIQSRHDYVQIGHYLAQVNKFQCPTMLHQIIVYYKIHRNGGMDENLSKYF